MKPGDLEYQALVEKKRAEIRGNIESKVMSPEETAAEIAQVTDGAKSSFEGKGGEVFDYSISPDGETVTIKGTDRGAKYVTDGPHQLPEAIQPTGYITKTGRVMKNKPGRKPKRS